MDPRDFRDTLNKINPVQEDETQDREAKLAHELESLEDGIEELGSIREELLELKDRLSDAIRAYAPDSYLSWKSYGLAQLDIIAGGDEYMSKDETISNLIEDLEGEMEDIREELAGGMDETVDTGEPVLPTRKERF